MYPRENKDVSERKRIHSKGDKNIIYLKGDKNIAERY